MTAQHLSTAQLSLPSQPQEALQVLARTFGTPLYVYDSAIIANNIARFQQAFRHWPKTRTKFAVKALSNLHILRFLGTRGVGLDAVSIGEIQRGLQAGFSPTEILFTPNGVHFSEFLEAAALGVALNIDSLPLLQRWSEHSLCATTPICLRVNPHVVGGGNPNIQVGGIDSKFGISIFMLPEAAKLCAERNVKVNGLHVHTGSDILDIDVFLRSAEILFQASEGFSDLHFIDFGSGFKVPYRASDPSTDVEQLGLRLCERFKGFCAAYGRELEMWFEPGKFLVSESGKLLTEVTQVKQSPACTFAMTNTGFHQLIRPMLYGSYHFIENISNPQGVEKIYTVVGNLCETDTFASDRSLAEVRGGDILAFHNAGAYGMTMASQFNSRPRPAEVLIEGDTARLIRRREEYQELWAAELI
jgi:diaminopimelate decarboxylase